MKLSYDKHQFEKKPMAASRATKIDFGQLGWNGGPMNVHRRSANGYKHYAAPEWVHNKALLQEVLLCYLERRFYIREPKRTNAERLAAVREKSVDYILPLKFKLQNWMNRYATATEQERPKIAIQIQETDREIVCLESGADKLVLAVIYRYYLLHQNSSEIAADLNLTPSGVRQMIHRLHNAWQILTGERRATRYAPGGSRFGKFTLTPEKFRKVFLMRSVGMKWKQISTAFGTKTSHDTLPRAYREYLSRPRRTISRDRWLRMQTTPAGKTVRYERISA